MMKPFFLALSIVVIAFAAQTNYVTSAAQGAQNQYTVQVKWGNDPTWHSQGTWTIGGRADQPPIWVRFASGNGVDKHDGGKTFMGQVMYDQREGVLPLKALRANGNTFSVDTRTRNGNWIKDGSWVIGGRQNQGVIKLEAKSADGGKTLVGTVTYAGEGPINFKAVLNANNAVGNAAGGQRPAPSSPGPAQLAGSSAPTATLATRLPLLVGSALKKEVKYPSPSGNHYLILQNDGNMIIKTKSDGYVWGLDQIKKNSADRVELGRDGSLVAYDAKGKNIWSPQAKRDPNAKLDLTFNGSLQLVAGNGEVLWSSDGILAPSLRVFIDKPNAQPCTPESGWAKCLELPDPTIKIMGSRAVSQSAMNGVANIYTEITKRFGANYPKSKFNGFKIYITNGEPWSELRKLSAIANRRETPYETSDDFYRGHGGPDTLWITEQMICKQGVKTRNQTGKIPDNTARTLDQVVHEFGHSIDFKYIPDQTMNLFAPLSSSGVEGFARGVQGWFGAPGATFTPAQEAALKALFTSRATFSCEGYRP